MVDEGVVFNYDIVEQNDAVIESSQDEPLPNEEHIRISKEVLNLVKEVSLIAENNLIPGCTRIYFVDALGVTGKTFVFNHIINTAVAGGYKVKCTVWIRFAATL